MFKAVEMIIRGLITLFVLLPIRLIKGVFLLLLGTIMIVSGHGSKKAKKVKHVEEEEDENTLVMLVEEEQESEYVVINYIINGKKGTTKPFKREKLIKFTEVLKAQKGVDPDSLETVEVKEEE